MWRWTKRALAGVVALLLLAALGTSYQWLSTRRDLAATPPPGQLVDIGGYRLHLWCMGAGAPAVGQMIATQSDHAVVGSEPELVVKAIRAVMDAAREGRSRPEC